MPLPAAALIGAGASIIQTAGDIFANTKLNKKTREWNEKMYGIQRQDALADWQRTNEYNSPQASMERLKAAGLNPNLVYDNGAGAAGSSAPIRSSSPGSWNPRPGKINTDQAVAGYFSQYDLKMKQAQIDLVAAQKKATDQDALLKASQTIQTAKESDRLDMATRSGEFDLGMKQSLASNSLQMAQALLDKTHAEILTMLSANERAIALNGVTVAKTAEEILNLRAERANTQEERNAILQRIDLLKKDNQVRDLDVKLAENGITAHDPAWMRALMNVLGMGDPSLSHTPANPKVPYSGPGPMNPMRDILRLWQ